jgi:hypothetical protein
MTPAIIGLTFAGLSEFRTTAPSSIGHQVVRFFAAVAMVTYLVAGSFSESDARPIAQAAMAGQASVE